MDKQQKANYDPAAVAEFERLLLGAVEYASKSRLPMALIEGGLRDKLAVIEGSRTLQGLRANGLRS